MKKINSEDSVQEFIAKLPKGNMFSRRSSCRLSLLPSNLTVTEDSQTVVENGQSRDVVENSLMERGSQKEKHKENFKICEDNRNSNIKNSVQKSVLLKEFHDLRKSRISSGLPNTRLTVATPSQNNPVFLSARKRTTFTSGGRNSVIRGKSPGFYQANNENSSKVRVTKRLNLRSSSCKKVSVHSSGKKGVFHRRNEIAKIQIKETIEKNVIDQDCRRALWFSEDEEYDEADKENTKPLPALQLSTCKTSGSMLLRRSTITVRPNCKAKNDRISSSNSTQKVSQSSENYIVSDKLKTKERRESSSNRGAFHRRYSSISSKNKPQTICNKQRRRSEIPLSVDFVKKDENGLSPISEKNSTHFSGLFCAFTRQPSKRNSRIPLLVDEINKAPQIFLSPPSNDSSDELSSNRKSHDKDLLTRKSHDEDLLTTKSHDEDLLTTKSVTIDKNDLDNNKACVKCSSKTFTDSQTNTSDMNDAHQKYFKEVETIMEKAISDQLRLENEFQVVTQEYFQKGKKIIEDYKKTFNSLNHFINDFKHILSLPVNTTQIDKKMVERSKSAPFTYLPSKNAKKEYKFLGTPLPKKNKNLIHSFSDPPTPTEKSPTSHEASFHSVDSVISPFTNIVGDLERPSILPMTPGSRHNFTNLKFSLNEQLDILFK